MPAKKQKLCFVLMPFKDELKDVYWKAIKPACEKAAYNSLRVDELKGVYNINRKIIRHIFSSSAIVADLTEWNPNVFYELGVAHAIDNKTIMIIQKQDKVPFDVHSYRCIQYEQTDKGLEELSDNIAEALLSIEEWRKEPANPVQDFKPKDTHVPDHLVEDLQKQLLAKETLLKKSVPKSELTALKKDLLEKEKLLSGSVSKKELTALQKETEQLKAQLAAAKASTKAPAKAGKISLRSEPVDELSVDDVQKMLNQKDFFDTSKNKTGKGLEHNYEELERDGVKLVKDKATGLTWQQSGSDNHMTFKEANEYVQSLNSNKHAGFEDWRLPTLEEGMSLMEPEQKNDDLYIDSLFDKKQRWIWTADQESASGAWVVGFDYGICDDDRVDDFVFVRAVR